MRVKRGKASRGRIEKALDGWQLGLAVVLLAWGMVMLVAPRPASPIELPAPTVGPGELARLRETEAARGAAAGAGLSPALRSLGSAVRAVGRAERSHDAASASNARREMDTALAALTREPPENVLALRALQTAAFLRGLRQLEATGVASRDVDELGGGLLAAFRDAGWARDVQGRPQLLMNDDELGAIFRKRWNGVVGLKRGIGEVGLTEEKLVFAFALRHARGVSLSAHPGTDGALGARSVLKRIDEYARLDPAYPADFARGVAHFGAQSFAAAQLAFDRHLEVHPDGPLTLRARNFARAAFAADGGGIAP